MSEDEKPAESGWLRFLESTGGTALITVVLGGVAGQLITMTWQDRLKERERGLAAYADYVKQEREIVTRTYEVIGSGVAAAEDLMTLLDPGFDLGRFDGSERQKVAEQRETVRLSFNGADRKWRESRESLGLLMGYYHHGDVHVTDAWLAVEGGMTAYMDCAQQAYIAGHTTDPGKLPCRYERDRLRKVSTALTVSFEGARAHATETR